MKVRLFAVILGAVAIAAPLKANAQSCTSQNLSDLGDCAYSAAEECRDSYPGCTTEAQQLSRVITVEDILAIVTDKCCVDSKTTKQQKSCIKSKVNPLVLRLGLLKSVASTPLKHIIKSATSALKALKSNGCESDDS